MDDLVLAAPVAWTRTRKQSTCRRMESYSNGFREISLKTSSIEWYWSKVIDLTDPSSTASAFSGFLRFRDLLIYKGLCKVCVQLKTQSKDFDDVINLNLKGAFLVAKEVLPFIEKMAALL